MHLEGMFVFKCTKENTEKMIYLQLSDTLLNFATFTHKQCWIHQLLEYSLLNSMVSWVVKSHIEW